MKSNTAVLAAPVAPTPIVISSPKLVVDWTKRVAFVPHGDDVYELPLIYDNSRGRQVVMLMFSEHIVRHGQQLVDALLLAARNEVRRVAAESAGVAVEKIEICHHTGKGCAWYQRR